MNKYEKAAEDINALLKKGIKLEEVYNILHLEPKYKPFKKFNK